MPGDVDDKDDKDMVREETTQLGKLVSRLITWALI
jgi:hypothetical protein